MAKFSCETFLDIDKSRAGASPYSTLTISTRKKIQADVEKQIKAHADEIGMDPASVDATQIGGPEGISALEHIVNDVIKKQTDGLVAYFKPRWVEANRATRHVKALKEQLLFHIQNFQTDKVVRRWKKSAGITDKNAKITADDLTKGDLNELLGKFYDSILAQNEYGHNHLDKLIQTTQSLHWGRMIDEQMSDKHGWRWLDNIGRTPESEIRILHEINEMAKNPDYKPKSTEGNENDFLTFLQRSFNLMKDENNIAGGRMTNFNLSIKPIFNKFKIQKLIKKLGRTKVIQQLAEAYDDATVINIMKHDKARKQYNPVSGKTEMRAGNKKLTGDEIEKWKQIIAENDIDTVLNGRADIDDEIASTIDGSDGKFANTNFRIFKNGEANYNIINNYTIESSFNMLWVQFHKLTRNHALTKKFGVRPREWFRNFETLVKNDPILKRYQNKEFEELRQNINAFVDNRQIATHLVGRVLSGVKNIQILKLGGIPFEQIFQETFFALQRMKRNEGYKGLNPFKFLAIDKSIIPLAKLDPKAANKWGRWDGISIEHMNGALANRYFGGDVNMSLELGGFETASRRLANWWLKRTGSTALSDMQAAIAYAYLKGNMTDYLKMSGRKATKEQSAWDYMKSIDDIDVQQRMLELEEAGIGRDLWNQTARSVAKGDLIDPKTGFFDPFMQSAYDKPKVARGYSAYDTWIAYFQNRVDAMGRMKASQMDMRKFFISTSESDTTWNLVKNSLFQFASFQLGFHRRVYERDMKLGGYGRVASSFAMITAYLYLGAITNCQVRQVGRGSGMYSWTDIKLHSCAFQRTGTMGKYAVLPFVQYLPDMVTNAISDNPLQSSERTLRRAYEDGWGPAITGLLSTLGYGVSTTIAGVGGIFNDDWMDAAKKLATKTGRSGIDMIKPSMPGLNYFIEMLTDMYDEYTDPKNYRKKQKRERKRMRDRVTFKEFIIDEPKQLYDWITD